MSKPEGTLHADVRAQYLLLMERFMVWCTVCVCLNGGGCCIDFPGLRSVMVGGWTSQWVWLHLYIQMEEPYSLTTLSFLSRDVFVHTRPNRGNLWIIIVLDLCLVPMHISDGIRLGQRERESSSTFVHLSGFEIISSRFHSQSLSLVLD